MEKGSFFAYSWHMDDQETEITIIRIYGLNEENENVCVIVKDFTPYVYLELPENVDWNTSNAQLVVTKINGFTGDQKPLTAQLMFKKRLYYANMDKKGQRRLYAYLFCSFSSANDIKNLEKKLRRPLMVPGIGNFMLKMHESNASPILQLTSLRKIPTAGWINFLGRKIEGDNKTTHCTHEYVVKWRNLEEKPSDTVAKPLLMGYDLEANSSIPSSMPNVGRPDDKIFQISCVFKRQGAKMETCEKYILTLGELDFDTLGDDEIQVLMFDTESDLLLGFTDLIQEKQPNIIMGYNIFTFDIPYMIGRAKENFCIYEYDKQGMNKFAHAKEREIDWSSSAYKNQHFQFLDAEGRIFVDLLPLVRRDYKFSSYSLKNIATHFLKNITKDPLDAQGIFKCYRLGMAGGKRGKKALSVCAKYCVKDSELVVRLFETLTTWVGLCEMSKVTGVPIFALYTQGQQIKVFSQIYRKCSHENTVVERNAYVVKETDHYVGATVFPPTPGVYDKVIPFDFNSLYPTTIIAYNICFSTLVTDDSVPDDLCHVMEWEDHIGCCHDPKVVRKTQLNDIIKQKDAEMKELRKERDKKSNKDKKEEYNAMIDQIKKETKPFREERTNLNKCKPKHIICCPRKYRWLKKPMGVLPEILTHLLDTRKATKNELKNAKEKLKKMKEGSDEYEEQATYCDVLDQRQNALKISANSGYGITGARKGYLTCMPVAMCTTYKGRTGIEKASHAIVNDHKGVLVYGDSVTPDTPILCRINGIICYKTIQTISDGKWKEYDRGVKKEISDPLFGVEVWTEKGFTKIKKVIRHECRKKIYQVLAHTGVVHVTEDHSLLDANAEKITPKELKVGSVILTHTLPECEGTTEDITPDEAYVWGMFFAEGSCGDYKCPSGNKCSWAINNQDLNLLNKCKEILEKYEPTCKFKIYDTMESSGVYKLTALGKVTYLARKYRNLFYDQDKHKIIPDTILNSKREIRQGFLDGFFEGDGNMTEVKLGNYRFDQKGKITCAGLYYLVHSLGYKVSVNTRGDKYDIYRITCTKSKQRKATNVVKKISVVDENYTGFVYDLETENHHFSAGIGQIIVHNTDSNYVSFPHLNTAKELWEYAFKVAEEVSKLYPKPMKLAFEEKLYWRFCILTKKRYMSLTCDKDGKVGTEINKKGVLLTRRDNSPFVRKVYGDVIMMVFNRAKMEDVIYHIIEELNKLCSHSYPKEDFAITKSIGNVGELIPVEAKNDKGKMVWKIGDYTVKLLPEDEKKREAQFKLKNCNTPEEYYLHSLPAQAQLAEKMRDRGQLVAAGSRIEYVITTTGGHMAKQYVKVESAEYYAKHMTALEIDYLYYLKQLANPLDQVLDVIYDKEKGFQKNFTLSQYKYRSLTRVRVLNELRELFRPKLKFIE